MTTLIGPMLEDAADLLGGSISAPRGQAVRLSSLLARQAFEEVVSELCLAKGECLDYPVAMRSRLIFIRDRYDGETAAMAETAWAGLSEACHHHSYELTPTVGEIHYYLGLVSKLRVITG